MKDRVFLAHLKKINKSMVHTNVPLSNHTSYKIGGNCPIMVRPKTLEEIIKIVKLCRDCNREYFVLGKGTNLLVSDAGVSVLIINMCDFNNCSLEKNRIVADSGATLMSVCSLAKNNSLSGMEESAGIPGSVGGAVFMNASAFGYETARCVSSVLAIHNGKITLYNSKECEFGYRKSIFQRLKGVIILQVEFTLDCGDMQQISAIMSETLQKRKSTQPINLPNAGSVFKRPQGFFVGKLIEEAGFKGYKVGDACVSEKHANFIVNQKNAKCLDVVAIIWAIKAKIFELHGINLELEIGYLGDEDDIW